MRDLIFSNLCGERDRCGVGEGARSRLTTRSCGGQVAAACDLYMCQDDRSFWGAWPFQNRNRPAIDSAKEESVPTRLASTVAIPSP